MRDAPAGVRRHEEIERLYRAQGSRMWRALATFAGDADVASDAEAEAFDQALRCGSEIRYPERWGLRAAFRIASGRGGAPSCRGLPGYRRRQSHRLDLAAVRVHQRIMSIEPATGSALATWRISNTGDTVAVGEGGVWFLEPSHRAAINRFDPSTQRVDVSVRLGRDSTPIAMAVAPGSVWVLNYEGTVTAVGLN